MASSFGVLTTASTKCIGWNKLHSFDMNCDDDDLDADLYDLESGIFEDADDIKHEIINRQSIIFMISKN